MRRPRSKLEVSTFPFLAVLLCAMGSLLLLLFIMDRRAKVAAQNNARETIAVRKKRSQDEEDARAAAWEKAKEQLHQALLLKQDELIVESGGVNEKLNYAAKGIVILQSRHVELDQQIKDEKNKIATIQMQLADRRDAVRKAEKQDATSKAELLDATKELAELEAAFMLMKSLKDQEKSIYSVVPYRGKRGDMRPPIYVECVRSGVIFHPEQQVLHFWEMRSEAMRDAVEQRVGPLRARQAVLEKGQPPANASRPPYVLFLVRPDGISNYYQAQAALRGYHLDFGYELVDQNWVLDFTLDPYAKSRPSSAPKGPMTAAATGLGSSPGPGNGFGDEPARGNGPGGPFSGPGGNGGGTYPGAGGPGRGTGSGGIYSGPGGNGGGPYPGNGGSGRGVGAGGPYPGSGGNGGGPYPGNGGSGRGVGAGGPYPGSGGNNTGVYPGIGAVANGPQPLAGVPTVGPTVAALLPPPPLFFNSGGVGVGTARLPPPPVGGTGTPGFGTPGIAGAAPPLGVNPGFGSPGGNGPQGFSGANGVPSSPMTTGNPTYQSPDAKGPSFVPITRTNGPAAPPLLGTPNMAQTQGTSGGGALTPEMIASAGPGNSTGNPPSTTGDVGVPQNPGAVNATTPSDNLAPRQPGANGMASNEQGSATGSYPGGTRSSGGGTGSSGGSTGSSGEGDGSLGLPGSRPLPSYGADHPRKTASPAPVSKMIGNKDFVIIVDCYGDRINVFPGGTLHRWTAANTQAADQLLVQTVTNLIARRQASVRAGEPPYRPLIRFQVSAEGLRTYYHAYPLLEHLRVPMSRENVVE